MMLCALNPYGSEGMFQRIPPSARHKPVGLESQQTLNDSIWLITTFNLANHQVFPEAILHPEPQYHLRHKWLETLA